MEKDFHFYAIYVLCRCNGMSPNNSKIIAYASQHTDDAQYEHTLEFEDGGRFQQVLSAHKFFEPGVFSLDSQYRIYVPFHFIPGNIGERFQERMVCRQNSEIARQMIREVTNLKGKPYILHRLGIALHTYADTWSHQDFSGLQTVLNDVEQIDVLNEDKMGIAKIFMDFFRGFKEALLPQLGHAEVATLPDEPHREWLFYHVYQGNKMPRKNWSVCQDACRTIYLEIKHFLAKNHEYKTGKPIPFGTIKSEITNLFKQKGDLEERCRNWAERINDSGFGFVCQPDEKDLSYDDREWFRAAVEVKKTDEYEEKYFKKENFHKSNWKYFHDAAASHRFFVLQELLSPKGIICG